MEQDLYSQLILNGALGVLIGAYGSLIGAGGGFLLVPLFLLAYGLPHQLAVGTSIAIVALNALSGTAGYIRQKKIDYRAGVIFALATVPGAIAGAYLTALTSGPVFVRVFGAGLLLISLYLFFRKQRTEQGNEGPQKFNLPLGAGISVVVGVISSWFGIGGGILHVPAMIEILRFPVHIAVATSQFILFFTALVGAFVHGMAGNLNWQLILSIGLGALIGAQFGVKLAKRLKGAVVVRYLALALFVVGLRLIFT